MSKAEAEALVQRIAVRFGRTHRGVSMWKAPQTYVVVCTHRATNTQFEIHDLSWSPNKQGVRT